MYYYLIMFILIKKYFHIAGEKINISSITNVVVIAAGKAAPAMAKVAEKQLENLITKRYLHYKI
ncbi:MAG: DUF4147 domain-containing protein [Chitinophagaceae bacterium]|nr:DUF4147 domain-containing protein [Chitinophagaceae bacterium]